MKMSEKVFIISVSVVFGAVVASLTIWLILNGVATYSYLAQKMAISHPEDIHQAKPIPLHVQPGYQNLYSRMDERVDRGDLGLMMFDTESGKRRIFWTSGGLEKWQLNEHPKFVVTLDNPTAGVRPDNLTVLTCTAPQGQQNEIYILGNENEKFDLEEWREVLAKDCDCATLTEKPSE